MPMALSAAGAYHASGRMAALKPPWGGQSMNVYLENSGSATPRAVNFHFRLRMAALKAIHDGLNWNLNSYPP